VAYQRGLWYVTSTETFQANGQVVTDLHLNQGQLAQKRRAGSAGTGGPMGLARVLQQLDLMGEVQTMSAVAIIDLLSAGFDKLKRSG